MYLTVLEAFQTILKLVYSCLKVSEFGKTNFETMNPKITKFCSEF